MKRDALAPPSFRQRNQSGGETYAMHEVFFADDGTEIGYTIEAVSPCYPNLTQLRHSLRELHAQLGTEAAIPSGDRELLHSREDVALWLNHLDEPVRDVEEEPA